MAADKKATTKVEAPKAAVIKKAADTAATTAPVQAAAEKKEPAAKKETAKKTPAKKTAAAKKETAKKPAAKKTATKRTSTKKAEMKNEIHIQYGGKAYSQEDLIKIARDVWKYDLKQKVGDLASIELYVKPEENAVYYVMNKDFTGSFLI